MDFAGAVNAIVEAKLLRSIPVVGPVLNIVLIPFTRIFEFKVTGTLNDPKKESLLPGFFTNPLETIRGMLQGEFPNDNKPPAQPKKDSPQEPPPPPRDNHP